MTCPERSVCWAGARLVLVASLLVLVTAIAASEPPREVEQEIARHYSNADAEVLRFLRLVAEKGGPSGLWLPENAFTGLSRKERQAKVRECVDALKGDYGRHLCDALAAAGALKDERLLPGLIKVATFARGPRQDNRPKWMAVAALGRLGAVSAVPVLIPLLDDYNRDTQVFARASLIRLTGENFGTDKAAWAAWWNSTGNEPALDEASLGLPSARVLLNEEEEAASRPEIKATSPGIGASDVAPSTAEITVTFDRDMKTDRFSWTGGPPDFPKATGKAHWVDKRTCAFPVRLEQGRFYRVGINAASHTNFQSAKGVAARPRVLCFVTKGAGAEELAALRPPQVLLLSPEDGAKNVAWTTYELSVTFDQPMGPGFSWTTLGGAEHFPETIGLPMWSEDQMTCTLQVLLKPKARYVIGLNSALCNDFQSARGVPLKPVSWEFTTGE